MKAIIFTEYGSPDVLQYIDIEKPTPTDDQVLVKVVSAAANPLDWHLMRADPFIVRLDKGFSKPKDNRMGADVAGVVEAVGKNVTEFKVGDAVFGEVSGAYAEYVAVAPDHLAHKPEHVSFEQAAAMPVVGFTALQGLRDTGHIQAGEKVLINGASGGIGTVAVQVAKAYGAEVTGVCSGRNIELVCSIGADHAIDYTKTDFTKTGQTYDLIYDTVGNRTAGDLARALKPDGRAVVAGFTTLPHMFGFIIASIVRSRFGTKRIGMMDVAKVVQDDLVTLADMLAKGDIVPVIDRRYPLSETADAIRYLETKRARGKIIITVDPSYS